MDHENDNHASARTVPKVGILGGGFGLYGWLPAVCRTVDTPVVTLKRYEKTLASRRELAPYLQRLQFEQDEAAVLGTVDTLVCAKRPVDQLEIVRRCSNSSWSGNFILEKPLAPTPETAREVFDRVQQMNCGLAVGFSLQATRWAQQLADSLRRRTVQSIAIDWRFRAHHFANAVDTWKRKPEEGGGALRFYAIHLLALLTAHHGWDVGATEQIVNRGEDQSIYLHLTSSGSTARVQCDSNWHGKPTFSCHATTTDGEALRFEGEGPFAGFASPANDTPQGIGPEEDSRIPVLQQIIENAMARQWTTDQGLIRHLDLWGAVEQALA